MQHPYPRQILQQIQTLHDTNMLQDTNTKKKCLVWVFGGHHLGLMILDNGGVWLRKNHAGINAARSKMQHVQQMQHLFTNSSATPDQPPCSSPPQIPSETTLCLYTCVSALLNTRSHVPPTGHSTPRTSGHDAASTSCQCSNACKSSGCSTHTCPGI